MGKRRCWKVFLVSQQRQRHFEVNVGFADVARRAWSHDEAFARFFLLPWCNDDKMNVVCKGKTKCYQTKDKKKCLKPNPWLIFLRSHKGQFKTIKEFSRQYRSVFMPGMRAIVIKIADDKNLAEHQKKGAMHNLLCRYFYKFMKRERKTAGAKKKLSADVAKLVKKNSVNKTLALIAGKKIADAMVARHRAKKKAAADVAAKKRVAETKRKMAALIIKKALLARAKAKKLDKEAKAAKAKAEEKSALVIQRAVKRARAGRRSGSGRGTKRRASATASERTSAKKAKVTAENRTSAASSAKRKADTLQKNADKAVEKAKTAEKAVVSAKKTETKAAKKKIPRALAGLQSNLLP